MGTFRALKGLVNTLADTFVSRNNDVSGYWAIGMLYLELKNVHIDSVTIDLLEEGIVSEGILGTINVYHKTKLADLALQHKVKVNEARITINFGTSRLYQPLSSSIHGDPFQIEVVIVDSAGRSSVAKRAGYCRTHNPEIETRSSRGKSA